MNTLKFTLRKLTRNWRYTSINVLGLFIGMISFSFIGIYIKDELSYDKHFPESERIYRLTFDRLYPDYTRYFALTPVPVGKQLVEDFSDIESTALLERGFFGAFESNIKIQYEDESYLEEGFYFGSANFLEFFGIGLLEGNASEALRDPRSLVVSVSAAKKYFGKDDPLGKTLNIGNLGLFTVSGIMDDFPTNQHFDFEFLANFESSPTAKDLRWTGIRVFNYIKLKEGASPEKITAGLPKFYKRHGEASVIKSYGTSYEAFTKAGNAFNLQLQPITNIRLGQPLERETFKHGNATYVIVFSIAALLILMVCSANFLSINILGIETRAKEIAIRKSLGSSNRQLITLGLMEGMVLCGFSMGLALPGIYFFLPWFNELTGKLFDFREIFIDVMLFSLVLSSMLVLMSSMYLRYFQRWLSSKMSEIKHVKNQRSWVLHGIITVQFIISLTLISSALIINDQLSFLTNKDLGYDAEQLLVLEGTQSFDKRTVLLKEKLMQESGVINVSSSNAMPGKFVGSATGYHLDKTNRQPISFIFTDPNFISTWGINLIQGRNFKEGSVPDSMGIILNKKAIEVLQISGNPIGKDVYTWMPQPFKVIGVTENFHFKGLQDEITPLGIIIFNALGRKYTSIKFHADKVEDLLGTIEKEWPRIIPDRPVSYFFFTENFMQQYQDERTARSIIWIFTILSVLLASLGILGVSMLGLQKRIKEIGVRKIIGASPFDLAKLLGSRAVWFLMISTILSIPASYILIDAWLNEFAYHIDHPVHNYVIAIGILVFVCCLPLLYTIYRTGFINPIEVLKED